MLYLLQRAQGLEFPRLLFEITVSQCVSQQRLWVVVSAFNPRQLVRDCKLELAEFFHTMEVQPSFSFLQEQQLGHPSTSSSG